MKRVFVPVGCMHCADPPCMHVCPSTATRKRADGIVTIDYDLCIGCSYCAVACPYQARYKTDVAEFAYGKAMPSEAIRHDEKRLGVATKCTFCADRVDAGLEKGLKPGVDHEATPACVNSCIAQALHFGDIEDKESNVSQLLAENQFFRMHEELGTEPGFYYLWDKKEKAQRVSYGPRPWQQTNWDWRAAANFMLGGTGAGLMRCSRFHPGSIALPGAARAASDRRRAGRGVARDRPQAARVHVFFNPFTSWMTRESYAALSLFVLSAYLSVFSFNGSPGRRAALAALAFVYCQARILRAAKGIPAWRAPQVVPLILTTALAEGIGLLLLMNPDLLALSACSPPR